MPLPVRHLPIDLDTGISGILRPLTPEDRDVVREAYRRLSPRSRLHRFWTPVEEMSDYLLDRLTTADQKDHVAWCYFHRNDAPHPEIGAASFWRLEDEPDAAEFSVTVADACQHKGVGTLLLAILWILAVERGISKFRAVALPANTRFVNWMRDIGGRAESNSSQFDVELALKPSPRPEDFPDTPAARRLRSWLERLPAMLALE